jgi:hypothetical protein
MDRLIKKYVVLVLSSVLYYGGNAVAEVKKASVPNVDMPISLESIMSKKDAILAKESESKTEPATNGLLLNEGNVIVDDIVDPKCVFYGNYNNGADGAFQYFNIDTIVFECK